MTESIQASPSPDTTRNGGQALVEALALHGVDVVFGIPGTHNLPIYSALAETGIRHVLPRHEQGAGFAADGYARVSGRPGVCITTTGPALINAATAAAQAYSDSIPVLFVAPGVPLTHPSGGNGLLHEIRDQIGVMRSILEHTQRVTSVAEIPLAVAQCFAAMTSGRPRPAYLEIPLDLLDVTAEIGAIAPAPAPEIAAPAAAVTAATSRLDNARRPLIIAGGGACGAATQVRELAERLAAPVLTTANGKGVLDEEHALSLGAGVHHPSVATIVAESDVIVAIGTELAPSDWWYGPISAQADIIRIDIDPIQIAVNASPSVALLGDAAPTVNAILAELQPRATDDDEATRRVASWRQHLSEDRQREGARYLPLCEALAAGLDNSAIIAADSAMACYYGVLSNLRLHQPRALLYPTGVGTLGYGLPAAIGAKIGAPQRQIVALLGDGGIMFTIAELASAAQAGLSLPVIVFDNGGYGEIRNEMADRGDPVHAVDIDSPDFAALGRALGCRGVTLKDSADLTAAVVDALAADRPTVIHLHDSAV